MVKCCLYSLEIMEFILIDKFAQKITSIAHYHADDGNEDKVINYVACENDRVYTYMNTGRNASYNFPSQFFNIAVHFLSYKKELPSLFNLEERNFAKFDKFYISKDSICIGQTLHSIVVFDKSFFSDMMGDHVQNVLSYIQITLNVRSFMGDIKLCFLSLISLHSSEKINEENNDNRKHLFSLLHHYIDNELYQRLFGLENMMQNNTIILLFGSNGHIWFTPLSLLDSEPKFLYSTESRCIDVLSKKCANKKTSILEIGTEGGRVFQLTAGKDSFVVDQYGVNYSNLNILINKCSACKILSGCPLALEARKNFLLMPKHLNDYSVQDIDLDSCIKELFIVQQKTDAQQTEMTKHIEALHQVKLLDEDSDEHFIQCTYSEYFMKVLLLSKQQVMSTSFHAVCVGSSSKTLSFNSFSHNILILADDVLLYDKIFFYRKFMNTYIKVDEIKIDVTNFCKVDTIKIAKKEIVSTFSIMFDKQFISQIGTNLSKFLFNIDRAPKTADLFKLSIVNDYVDVTLQKISNEVILVKCSCSNKLLSCKLHSDLLQKCLDSKGLCNRNQSLNNLNTKPDCILIY